MRLVEGIEVERAMVIYAHPDDAEFGAAGTAAAWARAGVEVTYLCLTNGAAGSDDPAMTRERLAEIRWAEQHEAAATLGVAEVVMLGFEDGALEPSLKVRRALAREVRRRRPDVLIGLDPTRRVIGGVYVNHPDHVAAGEVTLRTINPDASTRLMFPELWTEERLEPWKPAALLLMNFEGGDFLVDITPVMDLKVKALLAHLSQVARVPAEDFIRERNRALGREAGVEYAEGFTLIRLEH